MALFALPSSPISLKLDDGRDVIARPVRPTDKERLRLGFEQLSDRSRQLRFFSPMPSLSDAELRYLTEIDFVNHCAWGLLDLDEAPPGIGIGRFIRLPDRPDAAEFSLTVADEMQGTGAGRLLLALLLANAHRVGVQTLYGLVESDNDRVLGWMRSLGIGPRANEDGLLFRIPTAPETWLSVSGSPYRLGVALRAVEEAWAEAAQAHPSQNEA